MRDGPKAPPIEDRFCPPRRGRRRAPEQKSSPGFWLRLAVVSFALGGVAFAAVLWPELLAVLGSSIAIQSIAIGFVSALALYFYMLPLGTPIDWKVATRRSLAGGVFGLIAGKAALGFGVNESLQSAAAGVGGAKGPHYLDRIADKLAGSSGRNLEEKS